MRLSLVSIPPHFLYTCVGCRQQKDSSRADLGHAPYADLDGEAFKAYYCTDCAQPRLAALEDPEAWRPACNGTETAFTSRSGKRLLYAWQPSTGKHAYLDLGTDIILSDEEARIALATY